MARGQLLATVALRVVSTALVAAGLCLAAAMLVPALLGFERYVITGGSMDGTYDRGSLLYAEEVAVSELEVGDVITYTPPPGAGPDGNVTHRIVAIRDRKRGAPVLRTKGDANPAPDPWKFRLDGPTQARAKFAIPHLGYAFAALSIRAVRIAVIGGPAAAIALALLAGLWRRAGEEARTAGASPSAPSGEA